LRSSRFDDPTADIAAVSVVRHGVLRLTFADGLTGEVDVLSLMRGPVFERAVTPAGFATLAVDAETGTIVWPGGADLAPDTLYERITNRALAGREGRRLISVACGSGGYSPRRASAPLCAGHQLACF